MILHERGGSGEREEEGKEMIQREASRLIITFEHANSTKPTDGKSIMYGQY